MQAVQSDDEEADVWLEGKMSVALRLPRGEKEGGTARLPERHGLSNSDWPEKVVNWPEEATPVARGAS
jgi:hypothetical protein